MSLINRETIERNIRRFTDEDKEFRFLLGGIGTGTVSVGNRGQLCDWEIFNNPNKQTPFPFSFFALYSKFDGEESAVRILESKLQTPYTRAAGYPSCEMAGVPRFDSAELYGTGGIVNVALKCDKLPLKVNMTAFSPLIPTDEEESALPAIHFKYTITNTSDKACDVSVCGTQSNFTAFCDYDPFGNLKITDNLNNEYFEKDGLRGILFSSEAPESALNKGTMCLATNYKDCTFKPQWIQGNWWDGAHDFYNEFAKDGKLAFKSAPLPDGYREDPPPRLKTGSVACHARLAPGEEESFEFILSWCFPLRPKKWDTIPVSRRYYEGECVKNHYAYRFPDALSAATYFNGNFEKLYSGSRSFADALFSTTADKSIVDAINGTLTVIRSNTCFRIGEEGTFLCWEGCLEHSGSCDGNCTHVWNYAQTLAFLFPRLEQNMRRTEFLLETDESGHMAFRTRKVLDDEKWNMYPAADGQMGCVIRLYRDWKFSGNDELLKDCYPAMKRALDFAFTNWDTNGDCVLDARQHNTYDIEFFGENTMTSAIFFAALKAGSAMAEYMGDRAAVEKWSAAFEKGSRIADEKLFKNGYYIQAIDDVDNYKYQYGDGCLSDQLFGQTLAHINGLGHVLPKEHVLSALSSIYKNNFRRGFGDFLNVQRTYALNDESGLVLCSWPGDAKRPRFPFVYSEEVWSGIEYQVATCLMYEGMEKEALDIVGAVRDRHDGKRRSPFNEEECGDHYARSMASYGLLLAYNGFKFDMINKKVSFRKREHAYTTFFSLPCAFGLCRVDGNDITVETLWGSTDGIEISVEN